MAVRPSAMKTFVASQLADAKTQIRLLEFLPGCDDNQLFLQQSTWDVDSLPDFSAISYTWGDPQDPVSVTLNGKPLHIGRNCAYALWQAWFHYPKAFMWIDAICINQSDNVEKSHQVAMMGDIYAQAKMVLMCVGQTENDSDFFMQALRKLYIITWTPSHSLLKRGYSSVRRRMLRTDDEFWNRLDEAYVPFVDRAYWSRLWIVQEVACAKDGLILCGQEQLPWAAITSIGSLTFQTQNRASSLTFPPYSPVDPARYELFNCFEPRTQRQRPKVSGTFGSSEPRKFQIGAVFLYLARSHCSDPRDRLYGALQMIDWSSTTMGKIVPDYDLSVYDLALRVLPKMEFHATERLVAAFEMRHSDEWVVERRQERKVFPPAEPRDPISDVEIPEDTSKNANRSVQLPAIFVRIQCRVSGRFSAALGYFPQDLADFDESILRSSILTSMDPQPRRIFSNEYVKALACAATLPDDMLMEFTYASGRHMLGVYLVVRQRSEFLFDIVGQAVGHLPLYASRSEKWLAEIVEFSLSPEDQLFLFARDASRRNRDGSTDPWGANDIDARLQRLNTWVTASPKGAFRLGAPLALSPSVQSDDSDSDTRSTRRRALTRSA